MISLRDHGLMDAPELRDQLAVTVYPATTPGDYPQRLVDAYTASGLAAIEAVAGRADRMMSLATVGPPGSMVARLLRPYVLGMIGRSLIQWGESLHYLDSSPPPELVPAQRDWTVYGGIKRSSWILNGTLSGAQTIREMTAPRRAWLHVVREPSADYAWRGISAIDRAWMTFDAARAMEDALCREGRMPAKSMIPLPSQMTDEIKENMVAGLMARDRPVNLVQSSMKNFGAGGAAPQADWKAQRLQPDPTPGLVQAASELQSRMISALGAHPAIMGGASSTGTVDREARRQFHETLILPMARLVEDEASMLFGAQVTLSWPPNPDTMMAIARTKKIEAETANLLETAAGARASARATCTE